MGHLSRSLENSSAERNDYFGGPDQEISKVNNISSWDIDHSHILTKEVTAFCPFPKNLPEAKL